MLAKSKHRGRTILKGMLSLALALVPILLLQPAVQAAALDVRARTTTMTPTVGALQAAQPIVPEVDRFDQAAYEAQVALAAVEHSEATEKLDAALVAYATAETALTLARDEAWNAVPTAQVGAVLVNEPLMLAMLDLHIEIRRQLGPNYHTVVPGLTEDQGCAGDVVGERLIYAYGAAAASPLGATSDATLNALDKIARQVACLGAKQLAHLETAAADGFETVAERMKEHGLERLIPAFARLVAPVQVLILDARKHRGISSRAWHWFATYGKSIQEDVDSAGWASGELLVWDRRQGLLVGFPGCAPGQLSPDCVDLRTFLESIQDPRALGLGDCAFAGMLSIGISRLGGEERYTCPTHTCEEPQSTGPCSGSLGSSATVMSGNCGTSGLTVAAEGGARLSEDERSQLQSVWPQIGENDFARMGSLCRGGHMDLQGVNFSLDECFEELSNGNPNPFDTYAACMVEAVGGGDPPQIGSQLQGVPMGIQCGLVEGGGSPNPLDEKAKCTEPCKISSDPNGGNGNQNGGNDQGNGDASNNNPSQTEKPFCGWCKTAIDWVASLFSSSGTATEGATQGGAQGVAGARTPAGGVSNAAGAIVGVELQLLSKEGADAQLGAAQALSDKALKEALGDGKITYEQYLQLKAQKPADAVQSLNEILEQKGGTQDCVDPGACSNDCTGLGQQISAASACTEDLLDALTTALGLGNKDENLTRRLDIVSYPNPEAENGSEDSGLGACLGGNNDPTRQPAACGLMLCADGFLAMGLGEGCDCGQTSPGFIPQSDLCLMVRCADGNLPGPDCNCQPVEPSDPQPNPEPLPDVTQTLDSQVRAGNFTSDPMIPQESGLSPIRGGGLQTTKGF